MIQIILLLLLIYIGIKLNNKEQFQDYLVNNTYNDILNSINDSLNVTENSSAWKMFTDITSIVPLSFKEKQLYEELYYKKDLTEMEMKRFEKLKQRRNVSSDLIENNIQKEVNKEKIISTLNEGINSIEVGEIKKFCDFSPVMYKYFFLFLIYNEYKKKDSSVSKLQKYKSNLYKNSMNLKPLIENTLKNTKIKYNSKNDPKNIFMEVKMAHFLDADPDITDTIKVEEYKEKILNSLHGFFQTFDTPKQVVFFKDNVNVKIFNNRKKKVIAYEISQKIILNSKKAKAKIPWSTFNTNYCKHIQEYPQDIFTYEISAIIFTKGGVSNIHQITVKNICMVNIKYCFNFKFDITARKKVTEDYYDKDYMKQDFNKKLRKILEIERSVGSNKVGTCFDKNDSVILPNPSDVVCKKNPENTWSYPCTTSLECPYYKKNENYQNEYGQCKNNYCELPLGIKNKGYNTDIRIKDTKINAILHNCSDTNTKCIAEQEEIIKYNHPLDQKIKKLEFELKEFEKNPVINKIKSHIKGVESNNKITDEDKQHKIKKLRHLIQQIPNTKLELLNKKSYNKNIQQQINKLTKEIATKRTKIDDLINKKKKPFLISPDYAFPNDYSTRMKDKKQLNSNFLKTTSDNINLLDMLKYTKFM